MSIAVREFDDDCPEAVVRTVELADGTIHHYQFVEDGRVYRRELSVHGPVGEWVELKGVRPEQNRNLIWSEDDATCHTQDHEGLAGAYLRIFGEKLDLKVAISEEDGGDGSEYIMPNGAIIWASYPGASMIESSAEYADSPAYGIGWRANMIRNAPIGGRSLLREIHKKGWKSIKVQKDKVKGSISARLPFVVSTREGNRSYGSVYAMVAAGWGLDR